MARTRSIKPSFFSNDILAECEPMARLLFAGLWTIADRDGRMEYRPKRIKGALFPYDNCDIERLVEQLAARGFVQVYRAGAVNVLAIPTFGEHQRCHPDERSEGYPPPDAAEQTGVFPEENAKPGNPTHEPGNFPADAPDFPATCALYPSSCLPSSSNPSASCPPSEPPRRRRSPEAERVRWSADAGWQGITDQDRQEWAAAFPGCVLDAELAKATAWLRANPAKAQRSNWRRFLVGWLTRSQDRGGTNREPGVRPQTGPPPADPARKRWWRGDAGRNMSEDEYAAWRRDRSTGGVAAGLAAKLKIAEEK
ncbi:MAG: hypothetical protein EBR82_50750 [Caulobacteraceae bacterium]|nr:hypothetical protein [Caulobacteraceae bacterium]